jgi:hypothetical protein
MYTSVVQELKSLLKSENILQQMKLVKGIEEKFKLINNENTEEEDINKFLAQDLFSEVDKKVKEERARLKAEEEKHKTNKEALIEELSDLIKNEENIGKAFSAIKIIRENWNKENEKGAFKLKDLDKIFSKLIEDFYYNINIYKAIQEHDLKRNQQLKTSILAKLEACTKQTVSRNLMSDIKKLRNEWESVGPIKKEDQKEYWKNYHSFLESLYNSFNEYKASEKEQEIENLKEKIEIVEIIKSINISMLKSHRDWKVKTDQILECQKKWKQFGHVPSENKNEVWNEYRSICDDFFDAKKVFYDDEKEKYKVNKKLKLEICKTAEDFKNSENFDEANAEFIELQKKWKNVGAVHQRDEQFLWHKFQKSCNTFFDRKKKAGQLANKEKDAVNIEKEIVIASLDADDINTENLEQIYIEWLKTERVHTKKSNNLRKQFNAKFEKVLLTQNVSLQEFTNNNFNQKIEIYKTFKNNAYLLENESSNLKTKLDKVQTEITQYENNLGFFGNSKGASKLFEEVQLKIENYKKEIIEINKKLEVLKANPSN